MPASRSCSAVTKPAIPAPTMAMRSRPRACELLHATSSGIPEAVRSAPPAPRTKSQRLIEGALNLEAEVGEEAERLFHRRDPNLGDVEERAVRVAQLRRRIADEVTGGCQDV